ncbi:ribonuclease P protein component [Fulvivirga ligni]|uniref:ribonuclease P protein component n=1 Tax=Fulvivirga ligni TaxID=2904246 RepID=UPI001F47A1A3|nr:ribonuclease P protein component [Fulvivirga ligni]UII21974.1 ribonuclease P protein component [Fulvivirga ligni]
MKSNSFGKSERLSRKKHIQGLFSKGSSFYLYPFKVFYMAEEDIDSHQVLVAVSKKSFKRAVDRNKIKRRVRESYRLNKEHYQCPCNLQIAYIYTAKEILPYQTIEKKLISVGQRLNRILVPKQNEDEESSKG